MKFPLQVYTIMGTKLLRITAVFCGVLLLLFAVPKQERNSPQPHAWTPSPVYPQYPYNPPLQEPQEPQILIIEEPDFREYPAIRQPQLELGKVLSDIESHMPAGHIYRDRDKITWGHETSHGLASNIRMKFSREHGAQHADRSYSTSRSFTRVNGFYLLNDRAVVINEPNTTIRAVAKLVPRSLRGDVYYPYMVRQAGSWNDTPLYIFDEWVAYANGSAVRADLKIQSRGETVQYMLEFNVYSICVGWSSKTEDEQFKKFLKWHLKRSMELWEANRQSGGSLKDSDSYWEKVKTSPDAQNFREFAHEYLGKEWTKHVLGF